MILVKYPPGALGNFLSSVLINLKKNNNFLDYGQNELPDILHIWRGMDQNKDEKIRIETIQRIEKKNYKIINCNSAYCNNFLENFYKNDYKIIFINLRRNFIEYRLNFIYKCSKYTLKQNNFAIKNSFWGFDHPVACDEARRIFRLYQGLEQNHVSLDPRDIVFNFDDFYLEKLEEWKYPFLELQKKLKISINDLDFWFNNFRDTQKFILHKASQIRQSIKEKSFLFDFNENEKGIIIGEYCYLNQLDDNKTFDKIYNEFS